MDDTLSYVLHALDGRNDQFINLPRKFVSGCVMKPEKFQEIYFEYTLSHNQVRAYEKAEMLHERLFGTTRYSSYDSFRVTMNKDGSHR